MFSDHGEDGLSQFLSLTPSSSHASFSSLFIFSLGKSFFSWNGELPGTRWSWWEMESKLGKEKILHRWNPTATGSGYESNYNRKPFPYSSRWFVFSCFVFVRHSLRRLTSINPSLFSWTNIIQVCIALTMSKVLSRWYEEYKVSINKIESCP